MLASAVQLGSSTSKKRGLRAAVRTSPQPTTAVRTYSPRTSSAQLRASLITSRAARGTPARRATRPGLHKPARAASTSTSSRYRRERSRELRRESAVDNGLDPAVVAKLVTGLTVAEIEASIDKLAKLIGSSSSTHEHDHEHDREHERDPVAAALASAPVEKARAQRSLLASLHGPPSQQRDDRGRFAGGSLDGGARRAVPAPVDAAREHASLIAALALRESVHRGGGF
jgi:hypothetical protein